MRLLTNDETKSASGGFAHSVISAPNTETTQQPSQPKQPVQSQGLEFFQISSFTTGINAQSMPPILI